MSFSHSSVLYGEYTPNVLPSCEFFPADAASENSHGGADFAAFDEGYYYEQFASPTPAHGPEEPLAGGDCSPTADMIMYACYHVSHFFFSISFWT